MVERVLGDVRDAQVQVPPDGARLWLQLAHHQLHQGRLARSVGAYHGHARGEGEAGLDALEDIAALGVVGERAGGCGVRGLGFGVFGFWGLGGFGGFVGFGFGCLELLVRVLGEGWGVGLGCGCEFLELLGEGAGRKGLGCGR